MNWRLAFVAAPALCAAPAFAFAQGSVTLYGLGGGGRACADNRGGPGAWALGGRGPGRRRGGGGG
ncbi:porin, partial [Burkholderia contaminans]|nr:porin [Burkholderia contaminans]